MSVTSDEAGAPVRRLGKLIKLRPERREEYLRLHAEVWPEVRAMLTACGLRNYSIFLEGELLFSYAEYVGDDYAADMAKMAADPVTRRWWQLTDPCQEQIEGAVPGEWWTPMREVFHHD
ncbi:L-rhamnose mutarotase [Streptomyces platensis]|uniref:L-rhamnose mutarotase n=1 Tax=Streptomyces platensis TaxID=58346 RepID=UPI002E81980E|nr:L-rhamnose mutarotase [Streptomyces platensis]WUB83189.1 L-rhamnose mutarotase [Streptomyces platensis]